MLKLTMFDISIGGAVIRYYLMMAGTIILGFMGYFTHAAFWALVFAVSAILGVSIKSGKEKIAKKMESEIIPMESSKRLQKAG